MSDPLPPSVRARLVVKGLTPPYLWRGLKSVKDSLAGRSEPERGLEPVAGEPGPPPEWEYVPEGWQRRARGWNAEGVVQAYREKWPSFVTAVSGPGPLGVHHEVPAGMPVPRDNLDLQGVVFAFGYVLALAGAGKPQLSLLDWGGGPGHYAVLARALLPDVELDYHSQDVPLLAALGRELQPQFTFHDDVATLAPRYDLVVASNSLQYSERWQETFALLARLTGDYLYLTLLPTALHRPSFVVLQHAQAYGYGTEYLGWVVNRDELLANARSLGLELRRELVLPGRFTVSGAPEETVGHRGFVFTPGRRVP